MNDLSDNVICGRGEFQLHKIHVVAEVEVQSGIVGRVVFTTGTGDPVEEGIEITKLLCGQTIPRALEVKAKEAAVKEDRSEVTLKTALLEAFHRAIEMCLDDEE